MQDLQAGLRAKLKNMCMGIKILSDNFKNNVCNLKCQLTIM